MTAKELQRYEMSGQRYVEPYGQFNFRLFTDYNTKDKLRIYIDDWNNIIDVEPEFKKTEKAIEYIEKQLLVISKLTICAVKETKRERKNLLLEKQYENRN